MSIQISCQFDSGNIEVVSAEYPQDIHLRIRSDSQSEFFQWFHFRVQSEVGVPLRLSIDNAGETSYAKGWSGYHCVASYDRKNWFRIPTTSYDGQRLLVEVVPQYRTLWLAYFEPYSHERHQDFIAACAMSPFAKLLRLGSSVQGRDIDLIQVGEPAAHKKSVWVIARQHPGESMAEWCAQGFLERLLDEADPVAREVRERACIKVVLNMNPDGAFLGNLRANAAGRNLNREWGAPSLELSPEVWHVQQAMHDGGVDLFLDLHGDETLPYVFMDGSHMVPGYGEKNLALQKMFLSNLFRTCPDFQLEQGYADDRFTDELLTLASKWVAHTFGCVGLTLEMPFKDNANAPDIRRGWNGARSERMGAALLMPILAHLKNPTVSAT